MEHILDRFKLKKDKEHHQNVITAINNGIDFRGTQLWILIFAIFIASLGLNVNSTAVVIGAMLISPLMGPIMGLGLSMGINDLSMLKKAVSNYAVATLAGLATSTLFFVISPISDAHSEILARTAPNVYDVLIAFFGGLAGILATSSKQKGNVIPGVAIATALMPPLCTAGYGLATFQFHFFFGAFYLYIINTVFIALATFTTVRLLRYPQHHLADPMAEKRARQIIWLITLVTLLPSIYFAYDIVLQRRFQANAEAFIEFESAIPNDFLLQKSIDPKKKIISLVYGGAEIPPERVEDLRSKLAQYDIANATLDVHQGFAYVDDDKEDTEFQNALALRDQELQLYRSRLDSISAARRLEENLLKDAGVLYPDMRQLSLSHYHAVGESTNTDSVFLAFVRYEKPPDNDSRQQFEKWLEHKLQGKVRVVVDGE